MERHSDFDDMDEPESRTPEDLALRRRVWLAIMVPILLTGAAIVWWAI